MKAENTLITTAAALQRVAPGLWDDFARAAQALSTEVTEACISAPTAELSRAQGRAQEARRIAGVLTNPMQTLNERKK